jgi:hypothetical protein
MASFTVSKDILVQLMALQSQQMNLLQAILTGTAVAALPANAASVTGSKASGKGSRGPRGSSGWDLFKKKVRQEMTEAAPGVKYSLAEVSTECKRRKDQGEYDESYWKAQAAATKVNTSSSAAGSDSDGESETPSAKKAGRPKGSKNKTKDDAAPTKKAAAAAAPKKTPPPPADDDDEEEDAEVWEHKGVTYAKTADNVVWALNEDGTTGDQIGVYNPLTDIIE